MTGLLKDAPRIGMGCRAIGGPFWSGDILVDYGSTDDKESIKAIDAAWAAGIEDILKRPPEGPARAR